MKLQDRNLTISTRGDDVKVLQAELRQVGAIISDFDGLFGDSTLQAVLEFQRGHKLPETGIVDDSFAGVLDEALAGLQRPGPGPKTISSFALSGPISELPTPLLPPSPPAPISFSVAGVLRSSEGKPVPSAAVRAFHLALRAEKALGESATDAAGHYSIVYTNAQFPGLPAPDLIVRAFDRAGAVLVVSETIFHASATQTLDLTLPASPPVSEFTKLTSQLTPALEGIPLPEVKDGEIALLASKTGIGSKDIARLTATARLAATTKLDHQVCFALTRAGTQASEEQVLTSTDAVLLSMITSAVERNIIPSTVRPQDVVEQIRVAKVDFLLRPGTSGKASFGDLLRMAAIPDSAQKPLADLRTRNTGSEDEYWQKAAGAAKVSAALLSDARFAIEGAALVESNSQLAAALLKMRSAKQLGELSEVAQWNQADWEKLLTNSKIPAPSDTQGSNDREKLQNFAKSLRTSFEQRYPVQALAAGIAAAPSIPNAREVAAFLRANTDLNLSLDLPTRRLPSAVATLMPAAPDPELKNVLAAVTRTYRLAPADSKTQVTTALLASGLHSATAIASLGKGAFFRTVDGKLSLDQAQEVFSRAEQRAAFAVATMMRHSPAMQGATPAAINPPVISAATAPIPAPMASMPASAMMEAVSADPLPDWTDLFGSTDFCSCTDCRSVYSPAAYLVDLLRFLRDAPPKNSTTPLDVLLQRRTDIAKIELSCENTNTVLPYIDLVLEILERAALGQFPSADSYQTTWNAVDLALSSEHVLPAAYEKLKNAVYPWGLPFDLPFEQATRALKSLGSSYEELLATLAPDAPLPFLPALGLPWSQLVIICGGFSSSMPSVKPYWGSFAKYGIQTANGFYFTAEMGGGLTGQDAIHTNRTQLGAWETFTLVPAQTPVDGSSVAFRTARGNLLTAENAGTDGLVADRTAIGPWEKFTFQSVGGGFALKTVAGTYVTAEQAGGIGAGGTRAVSTDRTQPGAWETFQFVEIGWLSQLQRSADLVMQRSGLSLEELRGVLATKFVSKGVTVPVVFPADHPCDITLATIPALTEEIAFRLHRFERLRRALGWSIVDLDRSISAFPSTSGLDALNLDTLSKIAACETLRQDLQIPVEELLTWWSPIPTIALSGQLALFDRIFKDRSVAGQGPSLFQLTNGDLTSKLALDIPSNRDAVATALGVDARELVRLYELIDLANLNRKKATIIELSLLYRAASFMRSVHVDAATLVACIRLSTTNPFFPSGPQECIKFIETLRRMQDSGFSAAELGYLLLHRDSVTAPLAPASIDASALLADLPGLFTKASVGQDVQSDVAVWSQVLVEALSSRLKLSLEMTAVLGRLTRAGEQQPILASIPIALKDSNVAPTAVDRDTVLRGMIVIQKAAQIATRFGLSVEEVNWAIQFGSSAQMSWLSWGALPSSLPTAAQAAQVAQNFAALLALAEVRKLESQLGVEKGGLISLLEKLRHPFPDAVEVGGGGGNSNAARAIATTAVTIDWTPDLVVGATGWNPQDVSFWIDTWHLTANQRLGVIGLARMASAAGLCKRLGVSAERVAAWVPNATPEIASEILTVLRARYSRDEWPHIAKPIRDQLRNLQRASLVAFLVSEKALADSNGLFAELLIDVEMDACQMTSRIKQALSSVQLFVHRALLRLESGVELGEDIAQQWEWMKNYRVWEANRKIFLYPENWIVPELRSDKTAIFREFESQLLQAELTADRAEELVIGYLKSLDKISHLEICGAYRERDSSGAVNVLHVFGRTKGTPHVYFYRKLLTDAFWTAWEPVTVDIEGDHLIPVVYEGRLYIFWAQFTERQGSSSTGKPDLEVKLAWTRYYKGKWEPKQVAANSVVLTPEEFYQGYKTFDDAKKQISFSSLWSEPGNTLPTLGLILQMFIARPGVRDGRGGFALSGCSGELNNEVPSVLSHSFSLAMGEPSGMGYMQVSGQLAASDSILLIGPIRFSLLPVQQYGGLEGPLSYDERTFETFFYNDPRRTFVISQAPAGIGFRSHYHPYTCALLEQINRFGVDGVFRPGSISSAVSSDPDLVRQQKSRTNLFSVSSGATDSYLVMDPRVLKPYPIEEIEFVAGSPYGDYNMELFFHVPLMMADRLRANQNYSEALRWLGFIFDPMDGSQPRAVGSASHYWKVRPFFEESERKAITDLQTATQTHSATDLSNQITYWKEHPFDPHAVARVRPVAYMKAVVMKYLDVLVEWADTLFRQDTIESINEATQLYVLASVILGQRPRRVRNQEASAKSYSDIQAVLDSFSNSIVAVENILPDTWSTNQSVAFPLGSYQPTQRLLAAMLQLAQMTWQPYFCTPDNPRMLQYWDTVADRLFKIRHCMNIEGATRQLALFDPPIDPALLVRAKAAGLDVGSVLNNIGLASSPYRFSALMPKAVEFCSEVKALGSAFLSAVEKRDAEEMGLIRSRHERALLAASREVKRRQVDEAQANIDSLTRARATAEARRDFYANRPKRYPGEIEQASRQERAHELQLAGQNAELTGSVLALLPQLEISAIPKISFGGLHLSDVYKAVAGGYSFLASIESYKAGLAGTEASVQSRWDEWQFQKLSAQREIDQLDQQILAAEIRMAIAQKDLDNHDLQVANAQEIDDWMRGKFTNWDLYGWMTSRLSQIHFQSYQLAYDMAKRAQTAYRYEIGDQEATFLSFGQWDSQRAGLTAGEDLGHQLRTMESAYFTNNKRELEITRHVSVALLDPTALLDLRIKGTCDFTIPEALFDIEYPGHYFRRIKTVSFSFPCVAGPYVGIPCQVILTKRDIRREANSNPVDTQSDSTAIATSSAQNDGGVFEMNLRDERYLPFEGAGIVNSHWTLNLPAVRQFDYLTISDAILHIRYTARDGGDTFRDSVKAKIGTTISQLRQFFNDQHNRLVFSLRHDFPDEWHKFRTQKDSVGNHVLPLIVPGERVPYLYRWATLTFSTAVSTRFLTVDGNLTDVPIIADAEISTLSDVFFEFEATA